MKPCFNQDHSRFRKNICLNIQILENHSCQYNTSFSIAIFLRRKTPPALTDYPISIARKKIKKKRKGWEHGEVPGTPLELEQRSHIMTMVDYSLTARKAA